LDLFIDDEVDVEGLGGNYGMKSFSLKREHVKTDDAKAAEGVGPTSDSGAENAENVWKLFDANFSTDVSTKKKKK
jgi:hypothetical protein